MLHNSGYKLFLVLCLCFSALLITGCQGCRDTGRKSAEEKRKEEEARKEREKPSFETEEAVFYPGQYEDVIRNNLSKRGHWVSTDFRITANKFDVQGELLTTSSTPAAVVPIENTDYYSVSKRPFSIPKGEKKILSTSVFLPRRDRGVSETVSFTLKRNSGGLAQLNELHSVRLMKPFQYHMVVLTKRPDAYSYVRVIDSVSIPADEFNLPTPKFFTIVRTNPDKEPIALPRYALNWTTISYLIWDNLDVDQLDEDQQQALVDWLHYGGQLILSGPDCLDKLAGTFLEPYLPAKFAGTKNLTVEDFESINEHWAVKGQNQNLKRVITVTDELPILGVEFEMHPDSSQVTNTGGLAVERQLGRGRVVVTSFSLKDKPVYQWPSFEIFFNGALLRRPGREFGRTSSGSLTFGWIDDQTTIFDPLVGSNLRYLSRDLAATGPQGAQGTSPKANILTEQITGFADSSVMPNSSRFFAGYNKVEDDRFRLLDKVSENRNLKDHRRYGGFQHDSQSGTAGWNDLSGVSVAARETLRNAAGITPPSSDFVLRMLALYLFVLVPVNWLIFRMMGRVEWAWIAAPLIAIAGAVTVVRMASLDIGFVRSNTQVACLEVYSDYPRAHVAQYSALYTSLSTGYDLELDNPSAQSLPFGDPTRRIQEKTLSPVTLRKTINRRLEDFQVQSNSTGLLHTEMMYDMGGVFSYRDTETGAEVLNATGLSLDHAAIVRRTESGQLQGVWIGELPADSQSESLVFEPMNSVYEPWKESALLNRDTVGEQWAKLSGLQEANRNGESILRLEEVREAIPELDSRWDEFLKFAAGHFQVANSEELLESNLTYPVFAKIMRQLDREDNVSVRKMFQAVTDNLIVAPGETRLVAATMEPIGRNRFEPASTQTNEQTLVVVHLKRPKFEDAQPDVNSVEDFIKGDSNLDWADDESDWDEEGDDKTQDSDGQAAEEESEADDSTAGDSGN